MISVLLYRKRFVERNLNRRRRERARYCDNGKREKISVLNKWFCCTPLNFGNLVSIWHCMGSVDFKWELNFNNVGSGC